MTQFSFQPDEHYAYLFIDPITGEAKYSGKGQGLRWQKHWSGHTNKRLHRWILKLWRDQGLSPVVEIWPAKTEDAAFSLEIWFIHKYGRKDLGTGTLYNLTDGGDGVPGIVRSAEWRAKISAIVRGRIASEETKARMRATRQAHPIRTCPHCGQAGRGGFIGWHFDRCNLRHGI